jgi:hypothetical protein
MQSPSVTGATTRVDLLIIILPIQAGAKPVDENDCTDVQVRHVHP